MQSLCTKLLPVKLLKQLVESAISIFQVATLNSSQGTVPTTPYQDSNPTHSLSFASPLRILWRWLNVVLAPLQRKVRTESFTLNIGLEDFAVIV